MLQWPELCGAGGQLVDEHRPPGARNISTASTLLGRWRLRSARRWRRPLPHLGRQDGGGDGLDQDLVRVPFSTGG
jgi:hypothetical protein